MAHVGHEVSAYSFNAHPFGDVVKKGHGTPMDGGRRSEVGGHLGGDGSYYDLEHPGSWAGRSDLLPSCFSARSHRFEQTFHDASPQHPVLPGVDQGVGRRVPTNDSSFLIS